jgi:RNA polymerase sigma-70 factor (ECF subfamily)
VSEAAPTDEALLAAARSGDERALETLLERHEPQVYRFGLKMCGDPEDAKDVLQETLLAMARGIGDFRGASSISTWLYTIARSYCIKKRRRSSFAPEQERSLDSELAAEAKELAASGARQDEALAAREVGQALGRAIAALEPPYREVLLLRDVEGLTAPQVAEVLGLSVQAVKSRLHRARLSLRETLAPVLGIEPSPEPSPEPSGACPDVLMTLSQHLEDEISADQCAEMERHLEGCARCRGACDSLKRTLALCRTSGPSEPVPAGVQASVKAALRAFLTENR